MAGDATRERELAEQPLHPFFVLCDVRIDLRVGSFHVSIGDDAGTAVARTYNVNHVEIPLLDRSIQMGIDEIQPRSGSPMTEQTGFNMFLLQRLFQQGIVIQVDLPHRKVVCRPPVGVDLVQLVATERRSLYRRASGFVGRDCSTVIDCPSGGAQGTLDCRLGNAAIRACCVTSSFFYLISTCYHLMFLSLA